MPIQQLTTDTTVLAAIMARIKSRPQVAMGWDRFTTVKQRTEQEVVQQMYPSFNPTAVVNIITDPWAEAEGAALKGGGFRYTMAQDDQLIGQGVSGDQQVQGTGGVDVLRYTEGFINLKRKEHLIKIGDFNDQLQGAWAKQLATKGGSKLYNWLRRWQGWYGIGYALLYGHSRHIVGSASGELAQSERLHPNTYVCGLDYGTGDNKTYTTWSATTATFESALAKNIIRSSDSSEFYMTAKNLRLLYREAKGKGFMPVNGNFENPEYLCFLHEDQWMQLLNDSTFIQHLQNNSKTDDSGTWKSQQMVKYAGLIIFHGFHGPCEVFAYKSGDTLSAHTAVAADATNVVFGPVNDASGLTEKDVLDGVNVESDSSANSVGGRRLGWILGGDALMSVQTMAAELRRAEWDYAAKKGLAIHWMGGFSRRDFYNNPAPASATVVQNYSSLPFVTFSPRGV